MKLTDLDAYEVLEQCPLRDLKSEGLVLRHKKSGARIAVISNDDDNKVFYIGFRTPAEDSTGVPHIIEHTVLCGSDKYPVKDPFVELVKGSLNTFLNAITYPEKTIYPVASCNDTDFQNLMSVIWMRYSIRIFINIRRFLNRKAGIMSLRAKMRRLRSTVLYIMK